jgi:hypothetical protein
MTAVTHDLFWRSHRGVLHVLRRLSLGGRGLHFGSVLMVIDGRFVHGIAYVLWHRLAGAVVATVDYCLSELGDAIQAWVVSDGRRLRNRIHLDFKYARRPA